MRCLLVFLPLLALVTLSAADCNQVKRDFNQCTKDAHKTYCDAMKKEKEGDGKEHFRARKTCNYLTDAVETCGNKLRENDCNSEEEVNKLKDEQISRIMTHINTSVKDFDSSKCPAVKASLERVCAADPECVQDQPSTKSEDGDESGASSVVVGVLLLPLFVVHQL